MVRNGLFEFTILDGNGVPLPEYPDPDAAKNPENLLSCYIEVPPPSKDQRFSIKIATIKPLHTVKSCKKGYHFFPSYDGVQDWVHTEISREDIRKKQQLSLEIKTFRMRPEQQLPQHRRYRKRMGSDAYETMVPVLEGREMFFCPLRSTEINAEITSGVMSKETLGCIDVKILEIRREKYTDLHDPEYVKGRVGMICKALDVISVRDHEGTTATHTVGLGKAIDLCIRFNQFERYDYSDSIGLIRFKYRSRDVLQELGIVSTARSQEKSLDGSGSIKQEFQDDSVDGDSDVKEPIIKVEDNGSLRGRFMIKLSKRVSSASVDDEEDAGPSRRKKARKSS